MKHIDNKTYGFGVFLALLALVIFSVIIWQITGWWTLLISPFVTLGAIRPAGNGEPWIWEKRVYDDTSGE